MTFDGRSDKYATVGSLATILAGSVAMLIGGLPLATLVVPSVAGLWGSLILGQKYSDGKTNGATSGFVAKQSAEPAAPVAPAPEPDAVKPQ